MARPENPVEYTSTGDLYRGSRIRELRRKKGLSRERMADMLGCDPDALSKVETNGVNPSQQMLSKAAKLLEVPLEYFEQAPVHPRILRKKAAHPPSHKVFLKLADALGTSEKAARVAFLLAANAVSEEDVEGFKLVGVEDDQALESETQATSPTQHNALGQLTQKASSTSTRLNSPLSTHRQKILMHRLAVLKKKVAATENNLRHMREELLEIEALAVDMFGEEESHAPTPATGSV